MPSRRALATIIFALSAAAVLISALAFTMSRDLGLISFIPTVAALIVSAIMFIRIRSSG